MPRNTRRRFLNTALGNPFVLYLEGGDGGDGGGSGGGAPGGQPGPDDPKGGQPQDDPDGEPKPDDAKPDGDEPLGEAGKKALESERTARKEADKKVADLEAEVSRLRRSNAANKGTDVEAITKEITERVTADSNARLIRAEVKAAAASRLADPGDAPRFIDLTTLKVNDDGEVDAKAITKAIDKLLEAKPYLASKAQPWGDVGGGQHMPPSDDVGPGLDRLRYAYATESRTK
jgi:hypothetical protein